MNGRSEKILVAGLLSAIFLLLALLSFLSEGYPFGAENPGHYLLARYAWSNPENFIYLWGRPLFTLIFFPVAQFGMTGMKILNGALSVLTGLIAYRIMKKLDVRPAWPAILFVCFTPIWFYVSLSALTEVLFGFLLVLTIWLVISQRYIASAIVLSFLMFARIEGFILIPLFALYYLVRKKYRAILFLPAGFIFYSLAGALFTHDLLWIIHRFPYMVSSETYAGIRGSFFHYLSQWDITLGLPLSLFFLAGLGFLIAGMFSRHKGKRTTAFLMTWLMLAPFLIYYLFHTVLFWQGWGSSLGSVRLISAVFPLAAMIAATGCAGISGLLPRDIFRNIFMGVSVAAVMVVNFTTCRYPIRHGPEEQMVLKAVHWIGEHSRGNLPLYITSVDGCAFLGKNPYDPADAVILHRKTDIRQIPEGALLFWDSHFGPNELKLPRDSLMFRKDIRLVALFQPGTPRRTLGGGFLEVLLFEKGTLPAGIHNYDLLDSLIRDSEQSCTVLFSDTKSFDSSGGWEQGSHTSPEASFSGAHSYKTDSTVLYGPGIAWKGSGLPVDTGRLFIRATVYVWPVDSFTLNPTSLVISFERDQKPYQYHRFRFEQPDYMAPGYGPGPGPGGDVARGYI